ncbi:hypothetical protein CHL78_009620 [Romboutsia weinsteinii]|uniref:Carbohydrate-binding protein n=1 Tax=Romboutsia weinsteinii TaxID=2020949 RepID=A0A371J3U5_9FIRM|nr:M60 family metallopeptidase [Romboutsia weinsteinii]RDY27461.1 hypothetical protein CHL78_009620 [Romboutsia weinsteinii]
MKKRKISCLLALSMVASSAPVYANNVEDMSLEPQAKESSKLNIVGNLEADINFALPIKNTTKDNTNMKLSIKVGSEIQEISLGGNSSKEDGVVQIGGNSVKYSVEKLNHDKTLLKDDDTRVYYYHVVFYDLPCDTYTLELSGEGFKTLKTENIQLLGYSKRVIMNNKENFLFGDFDKDGNVTQKDYDEIFENLETKNPDLIKKYDLNKDQKVDITDLSYVYENMNIELKTVIIEDTNPIIETSKIILNSQNTNQNIQGSIDDLFSEDTVVSIGPLDDDGNPVEISEANPAKLDMELLEPTKMDQIKIKAPSAGAGYVEIVDENGKSQTVNYGNNMSREGQVYSVVRNADEGTININLGQQIAVKKISIVITEPTTNPNLAEIAKVEFLNNVYTEIPAPQMNIPNINKVVAEDEMINVQWDKEPNVTGYEIVLKGQIKGKVEEKRVQTKFNTAEFTGLENYNDYEIKIQSLNGEWQSGFSSPITAKPVATSKPESPDGVSIEEDYKALNVSWKKGKKAKTYDVYYKVKSDTEKLEWIKANSTEISGTSYKITGLEDKTTYEIALTATNEIGTSNMSKSYLGTTKDLMPPEMTNYNLINIPKKDAVDGESPTEHIVDVEYTNWNSGDHPNGVENKFSVVDNDYSSFWSSSTWNTSHGTGPLVTLDKEYTMDTIRLTPRLDGSFGEGHAYDYVPVRYFDSKANKFVNVNASYTTKKSNGKAYFEVKLPSPITTNKIQVAMRIHPSYAPYSTISEIKFYKYDSLEDEVSGLFKDELLVELHDNVTQELIDSLRKRANTEDPLTGDFHPNKSVILEELKLAEDILNDKNISKEILTINQNINNGTNNLGLSNDWQALGMSVKSGDEIAVYVGTEGNILPEIAFTQHNGESGKFIKTMKLKKGKNIIQVPEIHNLDVERGGTIYVRYPNQNPSNKTIKVRVSGAKKIPHLDVYSNINDKSKEAEVKATIREYIKELKAYVSKLPSLYPSVNNGLENKYTYDEQTSILNTTDIEGHSATLNIPATQVLKSLTKGIESNEDEQVNRLYNGMLAWEQIMNLTYAQRGVSENPDFDSNGTIDTNERKHLKPRTRVHIKYQRMFEGAFMYASSHHVGIGFGSTGGMVSGRPYELNEDGSAKEGGQLFGWGIGHEIGHVTEMPGIKFAETTNNMLPLLAQTLDDKSHSRIESEGRYEKVYNQVTSGTVGMPNNDIHLAMYWQLHLAYDHNSTISMLTTDTDSNPNNDSYFARLSKRMREATKEELNIPLEQSIIRYTSDAAGKDLREFYLAWGLVADKATNTYLNQKSYPKEERKIQYINDEARRRTLSKTDTMNKSTEVVANFEDGIKSNTIVANKDINIKLGVSESKDKILGYEIYRNGVPVGFTTEDTFTDSLGAMNNRVVKYEVIAYDYALNQTEKLDLGEIKVSHKGELSKTKWAVETNMSSSEDKNDSDTPHGPVPNPSINKVIDNKKDTVFTGAKVGNQDPYVIVDMRERQPIVGIKYTDTTSSSIKNYEVYVSNDKESWTLANKGKFLNSELNPTETVYFNEEGSSGGQQLWTHQASYVKIVAKGAKDVSIGELDIIGPPGDNIEIGNKNSSGNYVDGIGTLKNDFVYEQSSGAKIPAGSVIITGEYRGNPAYNVPLLKDEDGYVVGGESEDVVNAILLASIPDNAHLGEISSGTWIYWIAPENIEKLTSKVKAELYRVNDAVTNEGQRLVSDSLYVDIPKNLPEIDFTTSFKGKSKKAVVHNNKKMIKKVANNVLKDSEGEEK